MHQTKKVRCELHKVRERNRAAAENEKFQVQRAIATFHKQENKSLDELIGAIGETWKRIQAKTVAVKNSDGNVVKTPLNGCVRQLFVAGCIAAAEKIISRAYLSATSNFAGC